MISLIEDLQETGLSSNEIEIWSSLIIGGITSVLIFGILLRYCSAFICFNDKIKLRRKKRSSPRKVNGFCVDCFHLFILLSCIVSMIYIFGCLYITQIHVILFDGDYECLYDAICM